MNSRALFLLVATNILGGSSYLATAYAFQGFSPIGLTLWRTVIGSALFLPFLIAGLKRGPYSREDWLRMAAVAVFGYAAPLLLANYGQELSSATNAALLMPVEPLCAMLMAAAFLGEPLTGLKAASLACSILGSSLIVLQGELRFAPHARGDLLLILQGFFWALYSIVAKPALRKVDPMTFTAITTAMSLIPLGIGAAAVGSVTPLPQAGAQSWIAVVYLGVAVTFFGTLTWNKALERVTASQVTNFVCLQPVLGVLLGVVLLKESFTVWSALGGGLIFLGVYGSMREPAPAPEPAKAVARG